MYVVRAVVPAVRCGAGAARSSPSAARFGVMERGTRAPYATSKAAVIHLTRCLAIDLSSSGVRASCVCQGSRRRRLVELPAGSGERGARRVQLHAAHAFNRAGKAGGARRRDRVSCCRTGRALVTAGQSDLGRRQLQREQWLGYAAGVRSGPERRRCRSSTGRAISVRPHRALRHAQDRRRVDGDVHRRTERGLSRGPPRRSPSRTARREHRARGGHRPRQTISRGCVARISASTRAGGPVISLDRRRLVQSPGRAAPHLKCLTALVT